MANAAQLQGVHSHFGNSYGRNSEQLTEACRSSSVEARHRVADAALAAAALNEGLTVVLASG
eukprot:6177843-Pleurochrysis_carterae.AAC.2